MIYPSMSAAKHHFPKKHDTLLFYSRSANNIFNGDDVREQYDEKTIQRYEGGDVVFPGGYKAKMNPKGRLPYSVWQILPLRNVSKEKTGYPTQKPLQLLERLIKVGSNKGDIVLDPFCGCATTCVAASHLERSWIGIDLSENAEHFIRSRITKESSPLIDEEFVVNPKQEPRTDFIRPDKKEVKADLFAKSKICKGCDKEKDIGDMDLDHIVPQSRGGQDQWRNFQLLCRNCNTSKGAKGMAEWRRSVMQNDLDENAKKQMLKMQEKLAQIQKERLKK